MTGLAELQRLLLVACTQKEPAAWLAHALAAAADGMPDAHLAALAGDAAAGDGMRLTRLVVEKLRLERLLRGSPAATAAFVRDAAAFALRFRRYVDAVPPTAVFPSEEAAAFAQWEVDAAGE